MSHRPPIDATAVPAAALCLAATAEMEATDAEATKVPCTITARTSAPVDHWYWGRIVHDLEGMRLDGEAIPLDYAHDPAEVLGYADSFKVTKRAITAKGFLVPFAAGDRASEIIAKSRAGVPYQASIFFGETGLRLEEVPEGVTAQVNGSKFSGPGVIVREWSLRGIAICPYGVDPQTATQFSQRVYPVSFTATSTEPQPMPEPQKTVAESTPATPPEKPASPSAEKPAETPATPPAAESTPDQAATPTSPPAPAAAGLAEKPADPMADARAELRKFTAAFGANGATWFAEGRTFAESQALHVEALQARLADAETKLAAINRGEQAPLSQTPPAGQQGVAANGLAEKVGANIARVAAGIKIPGRG